MVEALVEGFGVTRKMVKGVGGGIWWRDLVEENGGGVGHCRDLVGRDLVEALMEGFGGGIWWSEGNGGG
jgi:hypothetical protein